MHVRVRWKSVYEAGKQHKHKHKQLDVRLHKYKKTTKIKNILQKTQLKTI